MVRVQSARSLSGLRGDSSSEIEFRLLGNKQGFGLGVCGGESESEGGERRLGSLESSLARCHSRDVPAVAQVPGRSIACC